MYIYVIQVLLFGNINFIHSLIGYSSIKSWKISLNILNPYESYNIMKVSTTRIGLNFH